MATKKQPHNAGLLTAVTLAGLAVAGYLVFQHFSTRASAESVADEPEAAQEEHFLDRFAPANAVRDALPPQSSTPTAASPPPQSVEEPSAPDQMAAVQEEVDPIDKQSREHASKGAIVGRPAVISSNALQLEGRTVVLEGIRVPWDRSVCQVIAGQPSCSAASLLSLRTVLGLHEVACYDHGTDGLGRMIGLCFVGVIDIGSAMVRDGWAVNDSARKYAAQESDARFKRKGIWWHPGAFDSNSFTQ